MDVLKELKAYKQREQIKDQIIAGLGVALAITVIFGLLALVGTLEFMGGLI